MKQPEGFDDKSGRVCHLKKSLYGLKQAPRQWHIKLREFLLTFGLKQSTADPCLFYFISDDHNEILMCGIYVDDGLVCATPEVKARFLGELVQEFKVTVEDATYFLSIQIRKMEDGSVFINQQSYAEKVLARFNMADANGVSTPIQKGLMTEGVESHPIDERTPYRQAIGSLMYLAVATRPDMAFAVSYLSQFLDKAESIHWAMVQCTLKYLKATKGHGLEYKVNYKPGELECYSDADYASDVETRKSVSGILCMYSGAAISWASRRQQSVSLSTTESEFHAASEAAKEIVWLTRMFSEVSPLVSIPTLQVDNISAVRLAKNSEFHNRTKHIAVRLYYIREQVNEGNMAIKHIPGTDQAADILTKVLPKKRFQQLRDILGIRG
jgi:Reverse transcriptase (RNA-dependent DNA polymerase)